MQPHRSGRGELTAACLLSRVTAVSAAPCRRERRAIDGSHHFAARTHRRRRRGPDRRADPAGARRPRWARSASTSTARSSRPTTMARRMRWSGPTRIRSSAASWRSRSRTAPATQGRDTVVLEAVRVRRSLGSRERPARGRRLRPEGPFRERPDARAHFAVKEDGVAQAIDLVNHERVPATFALLIDSSQSMSRRFDFVKEAAGRLTAFLRPKDSVVVAPFAKRLRR